MLLLHFIREVIQVMKMKIILLTLVSGTAALLIAQQTPSPGSAISPNKPAPIPPPSRQQGPPPPQSQQIPPPPSQNNPPAPGAAPNTAPHAQDISPAQNLSQTENTSGQNVSGQSVNGQNVSTQSVAGQNYSPTNPVTARWTGTNWEDNPSPRFIRGGVNTNNPYGQQR
jgi:hypothetical protein